MAYRVGRRGIADERKGLAAAAAEVLLPACAARAWLLHPAGAAKSVEGRRVLPDVGKRPLAHRPELEARNALRRMARQHPAGGRDVERATAPAADARFGITRIVIRHDGIDDDVSVIALAQHLHDRKCALDLEARWHEHRAILQSPAIVLDMRDLHPARAQ